MNRICHKFENLKKEYGDFNDGKNMLYNLHIEDVEFNNEIIDEIAKHIRIYKKHRKFITKSNNVSNDKNNKTIANDTKERMDLLMELTRRKIYEVFDETDKKLLLTYLLKVLNKAEDEQYIWEIMGDDLLEIIPEKHYEKKEGYE